MPSDYQKELKELSRDEEAYRNLKELFEEERKARKTAETRLDLLEGAIRNDYDSILITELKLEEPGPRIVYVNDGFCKMTGYDREEVIGRTPRILQGPKTDRAVLDKLKRRLKEGKSFFGQAVNYRKDGSEFVNQWDIHPLTDRQGSITHWVSYQHDITERKRSERMLVEAETEIEKLREASRSTVLDVDVQGNIVMANKAFRELTGYTKDELKQVKAWELFPDKFSESLKKRFDEGGPSAFDGQRFKGIIHHKNGVPVQVEGHTRVLELADQTLIRATIHNISLRKRIMETLDRRIEDFSRIFERASEFTYEAYLEGEKPVITYLSEEFAALTGLTPEKILGEGCLRQYVHEDDFEKVCSFLKDSVSGGGATCHYRIRNSEGDYLHVVDYCKASGDNGGIKLQGAVSLKQEEAWSDED